MTSSPLKPCLIKLAHMATSTLGTRLRAAMLRRKQNPATLARAAGTTEASVSNWLNDNVKVDHVKAVQLFRIADAAGIDPRELLLDDGVRVGESPAPYASHAVKPEVLKLSIQLVTEVLEQGNRELPPAKQAEAIQIAYDLLEEGLPQAKVLRFVLAAVA